MRSNLETGERILPGTVVYSKDSNFIPKGHWISNGNLGLIDAVMYEVIKESYDTIKLKQKTKPFPFMHATNSYRYHKNRFFRMV